MFSKKIVSQSQSQCQAMSRAFTQSAFDPSNPSNAARRTLLAGMYQAHGPALVAYAARRLRSDDAAQDVVQDAFASILTGRIPLPAVDVRRKLQDIVAEHCARHRNIEGGERSARNALREARERAEKASWRAWRVARACRRDPRGDEEESQ